MSKIEGPPLWPQGGGPCHPERSEGSPQFVSPRKTTAEFLRPDKSGLRMTDWNFIAPSEAFPSTDGQGRFSPTSMGIHPGGLVIA